MDSQTARQGPKRGRGVLGKLSGQSLAMTTGGKKRRPLHHDQPIETIETCAQNDLVRRQLDETIGDRPLFRFRLGGEKRLWGFRSGQVFHALWFDRKHGVYKQDKDKSARARKKRRQKRK